MNLKSIVAAGVLSTAACIPSQRYEELVVVPNNGQYEMYYDRPDCFTHTPFGDFIEPCQNRFSFFDPHHHYHFYVYPNGFYGGAYSSPYARPFYGGENNWGREWQRNQLHRKHIPGRPYTPKGRGINPPYKPGYDMPNRPNNDVRQRPSTPHFEGRRQNMPPSTYGPRIALPNSKPNVPRGVERRVSPRATYSFSHPQTQSRPNYPPRLSAPSVQHNTPKSSYTPRQSTTPVPRGR